MSNSTRSTIISYLGAGVSQAVAAEAAGVTPSYVSQLLLEPGVVEEIAILKAGKLEKAIEADATVETAEKDALQRTIKLIPHIKSAKEAASVFSMMNAAKRKAQEDSKGDAGQGAIHVTLTMPRASKILIQVNADNQIIDVDGRTTAPLPSRALPALAKTLGKTSQEIMSLADLPQHVTELKEKERTVDVKRAHAILADITTTLDGVTVVV